MTAFPMTESLDDLTPVTHPVVDLPSQAALLRQVFEGADIVPLIQAELDRLHHDLTDAAAYVSLSLLYQLTGDRENGLACLEAGLHYACLFRQPAPAGALRLLTICAQGDLMTNTPVELLLEGLPVQVTRLYVDEVGGLPEMIPEHDVALFAIGEAMGGLRYVVGDPSTPPSRMGISIGDSLAATFACVGALAALHYRERTGEGQVVDSAIYESVLNMMESLITEYDKAGYIRERTGAILPNVAPANAYACTDGMVLIAANQDTVFRRLADAMGRPELATDARYATHSARGANQVELDKLVDDWTRTMTVETTIWLMNKFGVPVGRIYRAPDMLEDEHFKAREAIVRIPHKIFGSLAMQNVAPKLSATPGQVRSAGPELGEHNEEIYRGMLGFDAAKMAELLSRGII